jgi:hypothetical protein
MGEKLDSGWSQDPREVLDKYRQKSKTRPSFGERLLQAAKEARMIARGEADLRTYNVYTPDDLVKMRRRHFKIVARRSIERQD